MSIEREPPSRHILQIPRFKAWRNKIAFSNRSLINCIYDDIWPITIFEDIKAFLIHSGNDWNTRVENTKSQTVLTNKPIAICFLCYMTLTHPPLQNKGQMTFNLGNTFWLPYNIYSIIALIIEHMSHGVGSGPCNYLHVQLPVVPKLIWFHLKINNRYLFNKFLIYLDNVVLISGMIAVYGYYVNIMDGIDSLPSNVTMATQFNVKKVNFKRSHGGNRQWQFTYQSTYNCTAKFKGCQEGSRMCSWYWQSWENSNKSNQKTYLLIKTCVRNVPNYSFVCRCTHVL